MSHRFDNQVAIITGGALGIGGATARRLAAEGATVLIADIDTESAAANLARIREAGGHGEALGVDVTRAEDLKRMVAFAVERWGHVDLLVQNAFPLEAGHDWIAGSAEQITEAAWDWGMSILVKALYLGARHALPPMRAAGGGAIVNVGSVHGFLTEAGTLVYDVAKTAVVSLTRQLAVEYGPENVRVNAVAPGFVLTEKLARVWQGNPGGLDFVANQYPLRRICTPEEIAGAIAFLCSPDAAFITGHILAVDGGLTVQLQDSFGFRQARYAREHPDTAVPE